MFQELRHLRLQLSCTPPIITSCGDELFSQVRRLTPSVQAAFKLAFPVVTVTPQSCESARGSVQCQATVRCSGNNAQIRFITLRHFPAKWHTAHCSNNDIVAHWSTLQNQNPFITLPIPQHSNLLHSNLLHSFTSICKNFTSFTAKFLHWEFIECCGPLHWERSSLSSTPPSCASSAPAFGGLGLSSSGAFGRPWQLPTSAHCKVQTY